MSRSYRAMVAKMADECLAMRTRMMARAVTAIYDEELRPFRITTGQLNVLTAIAHAAPIRRADLGRMLAMDASTLTRNVRPLLDASFIVSVRGGDRRGAPLQITETGSRLMIAVQSAWERAQARSHELLGTRGSSAILATAERLWSTA